MKVIYDLGAHSGSNIEYYLLKSDLVVAVEANPVLVSRIREKYSSFIENGRLVLIPCVIADGFSRQVPFYIHKTFDFQSQFPDPSFEDAPNFDRVMLDSCNIIEIIREYGFPYYVKIDLERYDSEVLKCLFRNDMFPPYISAECHSIEVYSTLVALGRYDAFKIVDGYSVQDRYKDHEIQTPSGRRRYSFLQHSAGPFGDDIIGPWRNANDFFKELAIINVGWKDVHASNVDSPD